MFFITVTFKYTWFDMGQWSWRYTNLKNLKKFKWMNKSIAYILKYILYVLYLKKALLRCTSYILWHYTFCYIILKFTIESNNESLLKGVVNSNSCNNYVNCSIFRNSMKQLSLPLLQQVVSAWSLEPIIF